MMVRFIPEFGFIYDNGKYNYAIMSKTKLIKEFINLRYNYLRIIIESVKAWVLYPHEYIQSCMGM